jgi:hypothetical protein
MAIASAASAKSSSVSAAVGAKKYKTGKTPTHTLSVCSNPTEEDKSKRVYTTLAFLFPTAFGPDANALGGAEMLPRESEGDPIQKNGLVKYFVTTDREGKNVIVRRVKASEADEKGKFERVVELKKLDGNSRVAFVGEADGKSFFVNTWSPKK